MAAIGARRTPRVVPIRDARMREMPVESAQPTRIGTSLERIAAESELADLRASARAKSFSPLPDRVGSLGLDEKQGFAWLMPEGLRTGKESRLNLQDVGCIREAAEKRASDV